MANDLTRNPIVLDTQMDECALSGSYFTIHKVEWVNPTGMQDGHKFHLQDSNGDIICAAECATDHLNVIEYFNWGKVYKGLYLDDLDSGYVLVWLAGNN